MNTTNSTNSTVTDPWGFVFLLGSSIFYGSNYLPVKKFETGDGLFFQLVLCIGIWIVGFAVNIAKGFPQFFGLPLLGGFFWATGNNCVVPIFKTIGMGLGMIFWGSISLIVGWATARFNLFGLNEKDPGNIGLNYAGVALTLVSTIFYLFVKSETKAKSNENFHPEAVEKLNEHIANSSDMSDESLVKDNSDIFDRMSPLVKRIVGISLAIFSGFMYGEAYTPILYVKENYKEADGKPVSQDNMDYLFSFYTGILVSSLGYFVIYCLVKKNKPIIYNEVILPGLCSGMMWGMANVLYFLANNTLAQSISFPISNAGPPIIANLWAVIVYKEIRGMKNLLLLSTGFLIAITGAVLTGLSS